MSTAFTLATNDNETHKKTKAAATWRRCSARHFHDLCETVTDFSTVLPKGLTFGFNPYYCNVPPQLKNYGIYMDTHSVTYFLTRGIDTQVSLQ